MTSKMHFKVGDKAIDKDGNPCTVRAIVEHKGWRWYEVTLPGGEAVRFDSDLIPA